MVKKRLNNDFRNYIDKVVVFAKGFHPPWTEGSRNTLFLWLSVLASRGKKTFVSVFTYPDQLDLYKAVTHKILYNVGKSLLQVHVMKVPMASKLSEIVLRKMAPLTYGIHKELVNLYLMTLDILPFLKALNILKDELSEIESGTVILHNAGILTLNKVMNIVKKGARIRHLIITHTTSDYMRLFKILKIIIDVKINKINASIAVTSPLVFDIIKRRLINCYTKFKWIPPLPLLGSVVEHLSISHAFETIKSDSRLTLEVSEFIDKYEDVALYIGELNQVRFSHSLIKRLAFNLQKNGIGILLLCRPSYTSHKYFSMIERLTKEHKNLHIITSYIDPWFKEKLLEKARVVIFPTTSLHSVVIDPPLSIIEAIYKQKPIVAFNIVNLKYLAKYFAKIYSPDNLVLVSNTKEFIEWTIKISERDFNFPDNSTYTLNYLIDKVLKVFRDGRYKG